MTPIKEQILTKLTEYLETIADRGYHHEYNVNRGLDRFDPSNLPMISIFQRPVDYDATFTDFIFDLDVRIQGMVAVASDENPDEKAVEIETDILEALFGKFSQISYIGGAAASETIPIGKDVAMAWGAFTIERLTVDLGAWEDGDAQGTMIIKRVAGTYTPGPATFTGGTFSALLPAITEQDNFTMIFGSGLTIQDMSLIACGIDSYPDIDATAVTAYADIRIRYSTAIGDLYHQK